MPMTLVEGACIRNGDTVDANLAEGGEKARDRLRHRGASSQFERQCKTGSYSDEIKLFDSVVVSMAMTFFG